MTDFRLGDVVSWNGDTWGDPDSTPMLRKVGTLGRVIGMTDLSDVHPLLAALLAKESGGKAVITPESVMLTVQWEDGAEEPTFTSEVDRVESTDAELNALLA